VRTLFQIAVLSVGFLVSALRAGGEDWPTARHDAQRTATTSQRLADQLHLQWVRQLPPLTKAWPDQPKLVFDRAYEPIVVGMTLFVGSSRTDSLLAFDTRTGSEKWSYQFDGPVRFAPAAWEGNLYVACDDGYLHCLAAETGKLRWKFRGGPSDRKLLGNQRLISVWPARGAPAVADGTVYFAAGIWPFMGIFLHALDARTGKVIWTSDGDGSIYIKQPHMAEAFGGVAPQGHLVIAGDKLLVPGGRSVPACYDRRTGKLLYFRLAENGKRGGGSDAAVLGDVWFNGGAAFDRNSGEFLAPFPARHVLGEEVIGYSTGKLTAFAGKSSEVEKTETIDRMGATTAKLKWKTAELRASNKAPMVEAMIEAGSRLYAGSVGKIAAIDLPIVNNQPADPVWEATIEGTPAHLAAADDRLFVVTLEGRIYCFGEQKCEAKVIAHTPTELPGDEAARASARRILDAAGVRDGYCIAWGVGTGKLIGELIRQSRLHVIVIDPDAERVQAFRRRMIAADLYGERVSAVVGDHSTVLPPYLASLMVSEDPGELNETLVRSVFSALRPYGGVACFALSDAKQKEMGRLIEKCRLPGAIVKDGDGLTLLVRNGALPGAADWTHEHADAGNSRASRDSLVKAPLGVLWFGGASHEGILPRHGHGPQPQVIEGRAIVEGVDIMRALDIYTGRVLWETRLPGVGKVYNTLPHQPGANAGGGNYVSLIDGIYVLHGNRCVRLDPATGAVRNEFLLPAPGKTPPDWTYLNVIGDFLVGGANPPRPAPKEAVVFKERLQIWDIADEKVLSSLEGHNEDVLAIAYSPDGELRASAGDDKIIRLWDAAEEKLLASFDKHEDGVLCLAFSADGKSLASGGKDKLIYLWDVETQKLRETLKGHREAVAALAFSADGKTLTASDIDGNVRLWDLPKAKSQANIEGNLEDVTAVALAPAGSFLAAGNSDGVLKLIYTASREARLLEGPKSGIQALAVAPDGKTIAAGYRDRNVRLWDATTGKVAHSLAPHNGPISCLTFAADGTLAAGTEEATVHLWDLSTHKNTTVLKGGAGAIRSVGFAPDGKSLATGSSEKLFKFGPGYRSATKQLFVMDRHTGKVLWKREARDTFRNNAVCLGGGRLYCIDRLSMEELARLKRRGLEPTEPARLLALDLKTGGEVWSTETGVFGTWLGYSEKHDVLVEAGRKTRDSLLDEPKGLRAFQGSSGKELWKDGKPGGPPLLRGDLLIHDTGACDLRTGKPKMRTDPVTGQEVEWRWLRTYGCNAPLAAENLMTFRSGAAGYCDLVNDAGTGNFGGFRASCTNNLVVAGGLIVAPDYTRNCTCSYQNQTSLALVPMPEVESWTKYPLPGLKKSVFGQLYQTTTPEDWDKDPLAVKHLALAFGAPGNRRAEDGRLWLNEYIHSRITLREAPEGESFGFYTRHSSRIVAGSGSRPWTVCSGCRGIARLEIAVKPDPKLEDGVPYTLRLHFADPDNDKPGRRTFDIFQDDRPLVEKLDVAKEAGGRDRGMVREFKRVRINGKLTLRFVPSGESATADTVPILSGLELVREEE
jgi:WD40 repeat protein